VTDRFRGVRDAREFVASRIAAEAGHEGQALSEAERQWLSFSESPDGSELADNNDTEELDEQKLAGLIRCAVNRSRRESPDEYAGWWSAIHLLRKNDLYINILLRLSGLRPPGDLVKLIETATVIVVAAVLSIILLDKFDITCLRDRV
jgi:hypothetical protein